MAQEKLRMNVQISQELTDLIDGIASNSGANRSEVIRQALALMKVAHDARRRGKHIGIVADADKLDTEIVGVL